MRPDSLLGEPDTHGSSLKSHVSPPPGPAVEVRELTKAYQGPDGTQIAPLNGMSLTAHRGEFLVLLGPSGCGKTTLLRCIAGLETPDSGEIYIHGRPMFASSRKINEPPERRGLGMIFQSYALWPHMDVEDNVAYPLRAAKVARTEVARRVKDALAMVGVSHAAAQLPGKLSGGQQQRVALARALVAEPGLVLFDEPLSNVDAKVREELRAELLQMQRRVGFTAIYVTHDQIEAMELADQIAVVGSGQIAQQDTPRNLYKRPSIRYVANFMGSSNEIIGSVLGSNIDELVVSTAFGDATLPYSCDVTHGQEMRLSWRPEATRILTRADGPSVGQVLHVPATVRATRFLGAYTYVLCETAHQEEFRVISSADTSLAEGHEVTLEIDVSEISAYPA